MGYILSSQYEAYKEIYDIVILCPKDNSIPPIYKIYNGTDSYGLEYIKEDTTITYRNNDDHIEIHATEIETLKRELGYAGYSYYIIDHNEMNIVRVEGNGVNNVENDLHVLYDGSGTTKCGMIIYQSEGSYVEGDIEVSDICEECFIAERILELCSK